MKILLVDDSKSARYALRLQLQRHGVEVDTADSAESAFELLKGELPDAILMDHMMPGLNGFEALEVIREDPRTAHLPVVMCTSHEDADFAAAAERKGVVGILPKSGAPEKLPAILAKLRDTIQVPNLIPGQSPSAGGPQPRASKTEGTGGAAQPPRRPDSEEGHVDEAEVMARLDERIATRITALLDDLRRDLSERLMAEVQRLLDSGLQGERQVLEQRLTAERGTLDDRLEEGHRGLEATIETAMRAHETAAAEAREAQIHALSERLSKEVLPSLVKVELEAERGQIMDLVAQYLRELGPQLRGDEQREAQRIASLEEAMASKAAEIARREAEAAAESVLSRQRPQVEPAPPPRPAMTGIYLAILAAAIAGIGAAAAVYILVS